MSLPAKERRNRMLTKLTRTMALRKKAKLLKMARSLARKTTNLHEGVNDAIRAREEKRTKNLPA